MRFMLESSSEPSWDCRTFLGCSIPRFLAPFAPVARGVNPLSQISNIMVERQQFVYCVMLAVVDKVYYLWKRREVEVVVTAISV